MKHPHAELMKAYADDCNLQIQVKESFGWSDCNSPRFFKNVEYRIKPEEVKMIRVGRHEWEEPLKSIPADGVVWGFSFDIKGAFPIGPLYKLIFIKRGVAHRSEEAAEQHRNALICINRGDVE